MPVIATAQANVIDINDSITAHLDSENGVVSVNTSGTPFQAVNLKTTLSIFKGNVLQEGWSFSHVATNLTVTGSTINYTYQIQVTGISSDSGNVVITAQKTGFPSISKKYTVTKVYQGQTADPAILENIQQDLLNKGQALEAQSSLISTLSNKVDEVESTYGVEILSSNGDVFRLTQEFETTLEARVMQGGEDISAYFLDEDFRWSRYSGELNTQEDALWNDAHYSIGGRFLTITQTDVLGRSVFNCTLLNKRRT